MSIICLAFSPTHEFTKSRCHSLVLLENLGVQGDCHCGETVQHRSRLHIRPPPKNLRQVHLIDAEILEEAEVQPADLGENVTTKGLELLSKSAGTKLHFLPAITPATATAVATDKRNGDFVTVAEILDGAVSELKENLASPHPIVVLTGLRNPCPQIQKFRPGLQEKFIIRDQDRNIVARRAGVMRVVEVGGEIHDDMSIVVEEPAVFQTLMCV
ncbi:hypothetical protein PV10_01842 [Exophiala mesophila]|uniref:MOSC domain-containing protein n=1 Tax=Exophiala mesophila TaxID=212818 RepID=A0A0D1ZUF2_EXOME|nr:uncharacterized protein PV10_01842 [Exophiala mesophila]KIV98162.1 hypothetical protein PV10_01842 [Exophiala mesophila]